MGSNTIIRQLQKKELFGNIVSPSYYAAQSTASVGLSPPQEEHFDSYYQETSDGFPASEKPFPFDSLITPTTEAAPNGLVRLFPSSQLVVVVEEIFPIC